MKINRILLLSIFLLGSLLATMAQQKVPVIPVDDVNKKITYKEVVFERGNKDSLYLRAIEWTNSFFLNAQAVTNTRDRVNGVIKGVHRFKLYYIDDQEHKREAPLCEYSFIIEMKDGRYRYTFTDFTLKKTSRDPMERFLDKKAPAYNPQWDDYLTQLDTYVKETVASLKKGMQPPIIRKDDW